MIAVSLGNCHFLYFLLEYVGIIHNSKTIIQRKSVCNNITWTSIWINDYIPSDIRVQCPTNTYSSPSWPLPQSRHNYWSAAAFLSIIRVAGGVVVSQFYILSDFLISLYGACRSLISSHETVGAASQIIKYLSAFSRKSLFTECKLGLLSCITCDSYYISKCYRRGQEGKKECCNCS